MQNSLLNAAVQSHQRNAFPARTSLAICPRAEAFSPPLPRSLPPRSSRAARTTHTSRFLCPSPRDGFVLAGDTAQTIARGVAFRFETLKAMMHTEFLRGMQGARVREVRVVRKSEEALHATRTWPWAGRLSSTHGAARSRSNAGRASPYVCHELLAVRWYVSKGIRHGVTAAAARAC
jgi:hypothetical protein